MAHTPRSRFCRPRSAKIIATLGPGSRKPSVIEMLALAGVDVFRLNFSHGSHEEHEMVYETIRRVEHKLGFPIAVLADMQGPKIRVGTFEGGKIDLKLGATYKLVAGETASGADEISVPHEDILGILEPGDLILLNDGLLQLVVQEVGETIWVTANTPGELSNRKGFTVMGKALPVPALTEKDKADLEFALGLGADFIALSFVQTADDVEEANALIKGRARLVAKLEKPAAIDNLAAIVEAADAVMVARGDLGVEFPPEQVPVIQRSIVRSARSAGKPVIVATQMLESMVDNSSPTRAEASDVATAIYQGVDGVMLSAETAVGRHPATAVAIMNRIIAAVEQSSDYRQSLDQYAGDYDVTRVMDIIAEASQDIAEQKGASAIALRAGSIERVARFSRVRGKSPVLYGSSDTLRLRQAQLLWGVSAIPLAQNEPGDWQINIGATAGFDGPIAYALWRGEDGIPAWETGIKKP